MFASVNGVSFCPGDKAVTDMSGYLVMVMVETYPVAAVMADGSWAAVVAVRALEGKGLCRRGDIDIVPVAKLMAVA